MGLEEEDAEDRERWRQVVDEAKYQAWAQKIGNTHGNNYYFLNIVSILKTTQPI